MPQHGLRGILCFDLQWCSRLALSLQGVFLRGYSVCRFDTLALWEIGTIGALMDESANLCHNCLTDS